MPTRLLSVLIALSAALTVAAEDPQVDIETVARTFRIQTYQQYRTNRTEYDRRIEAAEQALSRYNRAADDVGRIQVREWFFTANQGGSFPIVPEIALAEGNSSGSNRQRGQFATQNAKQRQRKKEVRDGFVVTDFQSNPRFEGYRKLRQNRERERVSLTESKPSDSQITRALRNPGKLFGNLGKSFLRGGNDDASDEQPANSELTSTLDSEDQALEAMDEITEGSDGNEFDDLNNRIVAQNLAISMFAEDFDGLNEEDLTIDALEENVMQLESFSETQTELQEQSNLFSDDQRTELTSLTSLESITTDLMTAVNAMSKRIADGEIDGEEGSLDWQLGELRMRLSKIMAEQPL